MLANEKNSSYEKENQELKIYYDLLQYKQENKRSDIAIVRLEQLYPLPGKQINKIFKKYPNAEPIWVQEEPSNMGSWQYINSMMHHEEIGLTKDLSFVARKSSASPATGFKKVHDTEQKAIVEQAFGV